ncbi:hypothetical protein OPKNFCMD_2849 [Methylobacterium crusticola]|uniref:DUF1192 domain-containing protein n=1 Tax=Methylobacterium crusticola TaxID=1697972 RepID=A0ABQ4QXI7_9HYPH|nr:DUF1192 domain-containing protein [Methylobacterium crusticola]GJD50112.1 hypothetical protein OPKNFCMD_2849 [Methylobacterium crusticola]
MFDDAESRPRPQGQAAGHVIGQDLAALSLADLDERVDLLRREIARLEAARRDKQASQDAAHAVFKI